MDASSRIPKLVDHLFRHETGKIVPVLTKLFGLSNLNLAEDVVQDSLVEAMEHWAYEEVPDNPSAWLFRVAKNKALNILKREKYQRRYQTTAAHLIKSAGASEPDWEHLFPEQEIRDDQLRMIFTCCHPSISPDSQIALALKTLCGFSIQEIARAFLTTEENVHRRLTRARQSIRDSGVPFELPQSDALASRIDAVLETVYLLFNEGYSASKGNTIVRYELCEEAMRLAQMLLAGNAAGRQETVHALLALMYINASRFRARQETDESLLSLAEQDRRLWDKRLLGIGLTHLTEAAANDSISVYHIQAAISAQYSIAADFESTDWKTILWLYDCLIQLDRSPLLLLNRAVVLGKVDGVDRALGELEKIRDDPAFATYHLFYSTAAEFYSQAGDRAKAIAAWEKAIEYAPLQSEKELLTRKHRQIK